MKKIILVAIMVLALSCSEKPVCNNPVDSKGVLVAYKVAKHSHLWLRDINNDSIYDVSGLGGRREPAIELGEVIDIKVCNNEVVSEVPVKSPENRNSRFVFLPGYIYLLD